MDSVKLLVLTCGFTLLCCPLNRAENIEWICKYVYSSSDGLSGIITSPAYPSPPPANTDCTFNFQSSDKHERIIIQFEEFDLYYPTGNPDEPYDCEDVDTASVNGDYLLGTYCGRKLPPALMSSGTTMEVVLKTLNQTGSSKGFKAKYSFVTDFGVKTTTGVQAGGLDDEQNNFVSKCQFSFHSSEATNGSFTSPNHPGLYPRDTECHYLFYGQTSERVYIDFVTFDVEGIPPSCSEDTQSDRVEASNYNIRLHDRKLPFLCGTVSRSLQSDSSFFRVTFLSNDVYDATGFKATYRFAPEKTIEEVCKYVYSSSDGLSGIIQSLAFPSPLQANTDCTFNFQSSGKHERIIIQFEEFDLYYPAGNPDDPYDCEDADTVSVNGGYLLGTYCGRKLPPALMSSGTTMEVVLKTLNLTGSSKGFKAKYSFVTDYGVTTTTGVQAVGLDDEQNFVSKCQFTFHSSEASNGSFTSPNHPGLYPRDTECNYLFYGQTSERVYIDFETFDVEGIPPSCSEETQSDRVEPSNYNIRMRDRKMSYLCGSTSRSLRSDSSFFRLTFLSNDVYDATGFTATYRFAPDETFRNQNKVRGSLTDDL